MVILKDTKNIKEVLNLTPLFFYHKVCSNFHDRENLEQLLFKLQGLF